VGSSQKNADWVLRNYDPQTTFQSSVEHEAKRLFVLKSYRVLESEREPALDELTSEMRQKFDVPWAVVSLVDYGRQWFMSIDRDDLGVEETSRQVAFCSHTVQQRQGLLVVPHALEDVRFRDNPLVQGGPGLRFYAGAALTSPEGYNMGALCVFDNKPRPRGLSQGEQELLKSKADDAVKILVERRKKLETREKRQQVHQAQESHGATSMNDFDKDENQETKRDRSPSQQSPSTEKKHRRTGTKTATSPSLQPSSSAVSLEDLTSSIIEKPTALQENGSTQHPLPDPRTTNVDPDTYLAMLIEARLGVTLTTRPALELSDFFASISESQVAAYSMEIVCACRENNVSKLREFHEARGRECLNCYNRFGEGLLNMACRRGFKDIVEFLLSPEVGLDIRICDDYGRTPLHDACWNPEPQLDICAWLMSIDPSLWLITDKRGFTPFQYARKSDWHVWREFLFDNREHLKALTEPDILSRFSKA